MEGGTKPGLLPSVEWTWANVMRNQQRVCSIRREPAMAPGSMRQIRDVTEEALVKEVRVGRRQRCSSLDLPAGESDRGLGQGGNV